MSVAGAAGQGVSLPHISIQHREHPEPTPAAVLAHFRAGHDTLDCARHFAISEPEAVKLIGRGRDIERERKAHRKEAARQREAAHRAKLAEIRAAANRADTIEKPVCPEATAWAETNSNRMAPLRKDGLLP